MASISLNETEPETEAAGGEGSGEAGVSADGLRWEKFGPTNLNLSRLVELVSFANETEPETVVGGGEGSGEAGGSADGLWREKFGPTNLNLSRLADRESFNPAKLEPEEQNEIFDVGSGDFADDEDLFLEEYYSRGGDGREQSKEQSDPEPEEGIVDRVGGW